MTEEEWLSCPDPEYMLQEANISERTWSLFDCACCRSIWPWLDERSKHVVEMAERYADGRATPEQLMDAAREAAEVINEAPVSECQDAASAALATVAYVIRNDDVLYEYDDAHPYVARLLASTSPESGQTWESALRAAQSRLADILREVAGNPFHPLQIDPAWLAWEGGKIGKIASHIYSKNLWSDEVAFRILHDALEEAGCSDGDILQHCRETKEHYMGCWVVDALLCQGDRMTEARWQLSADPRPMLKFLEGKVSNRKLLLFACASVRIFAHLLPGPGSREAYRVAEMFVEGRATQDDLAVAHSKVQSELSRNPGHWLLRALMDLTENPEQYAWRTTWLTAEKVREGAIEMRERIMEMQCALLRDIFGNPFCLVALDLVWLRSRGGEAVARAAALYDGRDLYDLSAVADALEEAGCPDSRLIEHCRCVTEHGRGCWAIDALLSKS